MACKTMQLRFFSVETVHVEWKQYFCEIELAVVISWQLRGLRGNRRVRMRQLWVIWDKQAISAAEITREQYIFCGPSPGMFLFNNSVFIPNDRCQIPWFFAHSNSLITGSMFLLRGARGNLLLLSVTWTRKNHLIRPRNTHSHVTHRIRGSYTIAVWPPRYFMSFFRLSGCLFNIIYISGVNPALV